MRRRFTVIMDVPDGADVHDAAHYIRDAVVSMGGGLRPPGAYGEDDPGDPMFGSHGPCSVQYRHEKELWETSYD